MKLIAAIEALKALVVLLAGVAALRFIHRDVRAAAEQFLQHLHVDPVARLPRLLVELADHVTDTTLWMIAAGAIIYAAVRFAEAYGLWHDLAWAKWLGAVSGAIYVPFELYELFKGVTPLRVATLLVNIAIVLYLSRSIARERPHPRSGTARRAP
jgi:uncharacterized membrane protein (DUF2068 family)